jgi:PBP1b-binding outer membrane lipoprotein LpoB
MQRRIALLFAAFFTATACSSSTPPPRVVEERPPERREKPPEGPTRTDFKTIAQKLVQKCVAGGWISQWRSTAKDVDQAKPRIVLRPFEDKTGQELDPEYLNTELQRRMRVSGVFDMVAEGAELDFYARGKLLRLAERTGRGDKISVYTATLEVIDPATEKIAYSCEATVKGEM